VSAAQDVLPGHFLLSEGILLIVYAMGNAQKQLALVLQDNFGSTLGLIAVLLAVLLFAYYATRYIGKKSGGLTRAAHMRVKERVMLQKDKSVVLLETKDKYYLIGVTGQNIGLIAELNREELKPLEPEEAEQKPFAKGVPGIMGLFNGTKESYSLFKPRAKAEKVPEDDLDALLSEIQQRRTERYGTGTMGMNRKPEFQEVLKESIDDTKGDA
jgi:flagellar protein FliO/FliZ